MTTRIAPARGARRRITLSIAVAATVATLGVGAARAQGFRGEYYAGDPGYPALPATPTAVRLDADLGFSDRGDPGLAPWALPAGLDPERFTVRWTTTFRPTVAGDHVFTLECADDSVLVVDGTIAIDLRGRRARTTRAATVRLTAAAHDLEVYQGEHGGDAVMRLLHRPPGGATDGPLPAAQLDPTIRFGAAARLVDFDRIPVDTPLIDQLAASDGVRFVHDFVDGQWTFTSRPTVRTGWTGFPAASPPNLLVSRSRGIEAAEEISGDVPLTIVFAQPQARVAVRVGTAVRASVLGAPVQAYLLAYDGAGRLVASDRLAPVPQGAIGALQVVRGAGDIAAIGISFGNSPFDELIDDLRFEPRPGAVTSADLTPPQVTLLAPTAGSTLYAGRGGVAVRAEVRDASGIITSVVASGAPAAVGLFRSSPTAGCAPPTCGVYEGSVIADQGPLRLVVTARDGAGNVGTAQADVSVVRQTIIHVTDQDRRDVAGAELFIDGVRHPTVTGADGRVVLAAPLRAGTAVIARSRVFEGASPRASHRAGGTRDWNFRVYTTNLAVGLDGSTAPTRVGDPTAPLEVQVRRDQAVVGVHLVMSIEWDASTAELAALRATYLQPASDWLWDATDGQIVIERVDIVDRQATWDDADFRVHTNFSLRANVNCRRAGFLFNSVWCGTWMNMSRADWSWVYTHEFGHYGLDLGDEYTDAAGALCTAAIGGSDPQFGPNGGKQACLMAAQGVPKLCSSHADNPHLHGTGQGDTPCWDMVARRFRDEERAGGFLQRWFIRTPTTRGGIVGKLAPMPSGWRLDAVIDNRGTSGLCAPSTMRFVVRGTTTPAVGYELWQRTTDGRSILLGKTDGAGNVPLTGLHIGDRIDATGFTQTIGVNACTPIGR